ncbi:hypothetical protein J2S89_000587 [Arthrobacter bambusae]|nr:hypothetical protein [Arthrobacter bambusae]MDQ0096427.1 hypothetical protein [Arthrobacter bambusae]
MGVLTLGFGSAGNAGGEAFFGAKEVAEGNKAGWDLAGGLFGTGGSLSTYPPVRELSTPRDK